jgi:poly(3-hydroxybutyrate) depolymerase
MRHIIDLMFTIPVGMRLAVAMAAVLAPAAGASPGVMTWNVAGVERSAIVHAPSSAANSKTPVVFAFHGFGDTNENFQGVGLEAAWPQAIVVYPQGLPRTRGGSALPGWQTEKRADGDRDLQFVDTALASLREKFKVDDARIYATGFQWRRLHVSCVGRTSQCVRGFCGSGRKAGNFRFTHRAEALPSGRR